MRQIKIEVDKTYIIANTLISSKKGVTAPEQWAECVPKLPKGSVIVSCGNLFGGKCTEQDKAIVTKACSDRGIDLWCIEGSSDYQILWGLARQKRISIGGDMIFLHDGDTKFCLSFYPLMSWPQKNKGSRNLHGQKESDGAGRCQVTDLLPVRPINQL